VIRISRRRFLKTLGLSGAGTLALGSSYGFAIEPLWRLDVTRYAVAPQGWPRGLKLSIAVIADLHAGGPAMPLERIEAIVEATNALGADTIVLLGDFAASHKFKTRSRESSCAPCRADPSRRPAWSTQAKRHSARAVFSPAPARSRQPPEVRSEPRQ